MSKAVAQYLSTYAQPEATAIADGIAESFDAALIVPACGEALSLLDGYRAAAKSYSGRVLCVLIVNAREDAGDAVLRANATLIEELRRNWTAERALGPSPRSLLGNTADLSVLLVPRTAPGSFLPRREGVGLARKLGCDIALALWAAGRLSSPLLFCSDADATLPQGHFSAATDPAEGALVFPYWHARAADRGIDRATSLYELWLRHYIHGLERAGSPYAWQSLGSALAVHAQSYAEVRGFPKRQAGEDFYLLSKLAKVAALGRADSAAVKIRARTSARTPFGTGRGVEQILRGTKPRFYHPQSFDVLGGLLCEIDAFAEHRQWGELKRCLATNAALTPEEIAALTRWFEQNDAENTFARAAQQFKSAEQLRFSLHAWFDGFRTLKLIHALRDEAHGSVNWTRTAESLALDPASDEPTTDELVVARERLLARERSWPKYPRRALHPGRDQT